jgi:hypothetical protein
MGSGALPGYSMPAKGGVTRPLLWRSVGDCYGAGFRNRVNNVSKISGQRSSELSSVAGGNHCDCRTTPGTTRFPAAFWIEVRSNARSLEDGTVGGETWRRSPRRAGMLSALPRHCLFAGSVLFGNCSRHLETRLWKPIRSDSCGTSAACDRSSLCLCRMDSVT